MNFSSLHKIPCVNVAQNFSSRVHSLKATVDWRNVDDDEEDEYGEE